MLCLRVDLHQNFFAIYIGNFKKEVEVIRTRYEDRANKTVRAIGNALQGVPRDLWMCDPKNLHVEG